MLNQHTIHYDINIHDPLTRAYSMVQIIIHEPLVPLAKTQYDTHNSHEMIRTIIMR